MAANTGGTPGGASGGTPPSMRRARRSEALAGYAMIAMPMLLFLVLQIGTIFYALFISFWDWNFRSGPEEFRGLANYEARPHRPNVPHSDQEHPLLRVRLGPADDGRRTLPGGRRQPEDPRPDLLPGAFYFPAIASSAAITVLWIFIVSPVRPVQQLRGALGLNPLFELFGSGRNQDWIGDQERR